MTNTSAAPFKCFVVEYATALVFRAGKLSPSNFLGRNEEDEGKKRSLSRKWWLARSFKFKSRDEAKRMKKGLDIAHTQTLWRSFMHYSWRKLNNTYTTKFKPFFLVFWRQEIVKNLFIFFNLLSNLLIFAQHFFFVISMLTDLVVERSSCCYQQSGDDLENKKYLKGGYQKAY